MGRKGHVVYELHVGAYTREGTYRALEAQLPYLRDLGVTLVELMPLATFPGAFNWGYDGVALFAPRPQYGSPDDLRRLVDRRTRSASASSSTSSTTTSGRTGNYLHSLRGLPDRRYPDEWGEPLNFDGAKARGRRATSSSTTRATWIRDYHFDGLRLDATQSLYDASSTHIVKELVAAARAAPRARPVPVSARTSSRTRACLEDRRSTPSGSTTFTTRLGGGDRRRRGVPPDYEGSARSCSPACCATPLYQGQWYAWQKKPPRHAAAQRRARAHRLLRCRTTIRSPTAFTAAACTRTQARLLGARADVVLAARSADAACSSWARSTSRRRPFCTSSTTSRRCMKDGRRGAGATSSQFPSIAQTPWTARARDAAQRPTRPSTPRSWTSTSAPARRGPAAAQRAARACARDPVSRRSRPDGAAAHADTLCAARAPGGTGCCCSTSGPTVRWRLPRSRCSLRSQGNRWKLLFSSEASRFGGTRRPRVRRERGLAHPRPTALCSRSREET